MYKLITFIRPYAKYFLAVWVIAIVTVSSVPSVPVLKLHIQKADIRLDYLIHFLEYGSLAFLAYLSFAGRDFRVSALKYLTLTVCLIIFALADESHQIFIPGRTFNPKDILSNIAGIIGGLLFCSVLFRRIPVKFRAKAQQ
jgi:VanZ family protein